MSAGRAGKWHVVPLGFSGRFAVRHSSGRLDRDVKRGNQGGKVKRYTREDALERVRLLNGWHAQDLNREPPPTHQNSTE